MIQVIETKDASEFQTTVNTLIEQGYKLLCSSIEKTNYDDCLYFRAILESAGIKNSVIKSCEACSNKDISYFCHPCTKCNGKYSEFKPKDKI